MENKKDRKLVGAGLITALAASLCCITPVLALFAGVSGAASTFSWIEPFRPYLIGSTVLVLAFAWYQKLKRKKEIECNCEDKEKSPFLQGKLFLAIVTVFTGIMLAFPYYASVFYPSKKIVSKNKQINVQVLNLKVKGMTCESCNLHIEHEVAQLEGYLDVNANYKTGKVYVKYYSLKTSKKEVIQAINKTGYKIIE